MSTEFGSDIDLACWSRSVRSLELRQEQDPDPERAEALQALRTVLILACAAGGDSVDGFSSGSLAHSTQTSTQIWIDYLQLVDSSSLGSDAARTRRRAGTAAKIADILARSEG